MVGDVGFDPLGFTTKYDIKWLREAELKHGRVSMLAAFGCLFQEFIHLPFEATVSMPGLPIRMQDVRVLSPLFTDPTHGWKSYV